MKLTIDRVTKQYRSKLALKSFSAELGCGVYGLLGPNGAGKSTLMNIIVGLLRPNQGCVLCNGKDTRSMGAEYRSMLGYLPQNVGMYKNFSGKKMLMYLAALKGIPSKREAEQAVDQVLEQVNLSQDKNRRIGQYSGGMRQRLGIAQALIGDPQLLIFDEPTAGLDPKERIRFMNIISELANERTILLATHIVSDIEQIAGQILFLKEGELIAQGSLSQCLDLLKNSVFEKLCTHQEYEKIVEDYRISRVISAGEKLMVRFVGPQPIEDSHLVEPTLEDVYIHFFGEAGI